MPAKRKGRRVLGPYEVGRETWRIIVVEADGTRASRDLSGEDAKEAALELARSLAIEIKLQGQVKVGQAIDQYAEYLRGANAAKPVRAQWRDAIHRLELMFPKEQAPLPDPLMPFVKGWAGRDEFVLENLTHRMGELLYESLRTRKRYRVSPKTKVTIELPPVAVDTHRIALAEAKTFLRWCAKRRLIPGNPWEHVHGEGAKNPGGMGRKFETRLDEMRTFYRTALSRARRGDEGAMAGLMAILFGIRAKEITLRRVRDIDNGGTVLCIDGRVKTRRSVRRLRIPADIRPIFGLFTRGKRPDQYILGDGDKPHWRDYPRESIQRMCKELGLPPYTAHLLRGAHGQRARAEGATAEIVAAQLGHEDVRTTNRSYVDESALVSDSASSMLDALSGPPSN